MSLNQLFELVIKTNSFAMKKYKIKVLTQCDELRKHQFACFQMKPNFTCHHQKVKTLPKKCEIHKTPQNVELKFYFFKATTRKTRADAV